MSAGSSLDGTASAGASSRPTYAAFVAVLRRTAVDYAIARPARLGATRGHPPEERDEKDFTFPHPPEGVFHNLSEAL